MKDAALPEGKPPQKSTEEVIELQRAIDANDLARVQALLTGNPALHRAPIGYGEAGPLTWAAECRVPWETPGAVRLAMAEWMIGHGSDVHQGGDAPLMRAALNGYRIPMMELLVQQGADVNALWQGNYPIVFAPCESMDSEALAWLLVHGANPNRRDHGYQYNGHSYAGTALDYLIAGYGRSPERMRACVEVLLAAGGATRFDVPGMLAILRRRTDELEGLLHGQTGLAARQFAELDCGQTGGRSLLLRGATLLHAAAEYGNTEAAALLLRNGAGVNARAAVDAEGTGGQTPLFHAVSQYDDTGLAMVQLLLAKGADTQVRARVPGDYERPEETVTCTALGYALRFGGEPDRPTVRLLREYGAAE